MWVVGFRNLPYARQDTNVAINSYHNYMKSTLKVERSRMTRQRVDWCIQALTGDGLIYYWYLALRKKYDFVENRKKCAIIAFAFILARDISDTH